MVESAHFVFSAGLIAIAMLVWHTIEVGRNDAANIVNAVFGARVMRRRTAVRIAGLAVILGAWASSPVMETARKGIFDPAMLSLRDALSVYLAVYLTDTVLLYSFSAFGMPISTTACLVFSLLGGGLILGGSEAVQQDKSEQVVFAIVCSIIVSGIAGFLIQRVFRGAIGKECDDLRRVRLHGPWISGALLTGLVYFILIKGMKDIGLIQTVRSGTIDVLGAPAILIILWFVLSIITKAILSIGSDAVSRNLFAGLAVLGMISIAVAFGQNDLANCASPGVAAYMILQKGKIHHEFPVPGYLLLMCGCLLAVGMATRTAQRVTRAEVNTGSQGDIVRLYAPRWCLWLAKKMITERKEEKPLAPEAALPDSKKLQHYDALRAAVITSVSASVIAFASGLGLPVSTTYVAFASVVATGWADQIFLRGDAHLKVARTIWVIFGWFFSAIIAVAATGATAKLISVAGTWGIGVALAVNLTVRVVMHKRADLQEKRLREDASRRRKRYMGESEAAEHPLFATDTDSDEM